MFYNKIGDDGVKAIAEALKDNPVLTSLDLRLNHIGDEGAKAITEALKVNAVLNNFPNASGTLRRTPLWLRTHSGSCAWGSGVCARVVLNSSSPISVFWGAAACSPTQAHCQSR